MNEFPFILLETNKIKGDFNLNNKVIVNLLLIKNDINLQK